MKVSIGTREFEIDADAVGGILASMSEEGFDRLDLSDRIGEVDFVLFCRSEEAVGFTDEEIVRAYGTAHYLQSERALLSLGRELSKRVSRCSYPELKLLLSYFDK